MQTTFTTTTMLIVNSFLESYFKAQVLKGPRVRLYKGKQIECFIRFQLPKTRKTLTEIHI